MKYIPLRPWLDNSALRPWFWDDEEWPEVSMTEGLNVYEENNEVVIQAAVPGVSADKIKVTYEDGVLRVSGSVEEKEEKTKKGRMVHQWQKVSRFDYSTYLKRPVDSKTLSAETKDGVVTIRAKITDEAKAREIPVRVASK